jgi:hypothetical protein
MATRLLYYLTANDTYLAEISDLVYGVATAVPAVTPGRVARVLTM